MNLLGDFNDEVVAFDFTDTLSALKNEFELKTQGSEAKLYSGLFLNRWPSILKERFVKTYRHPDLDRSLSVERMKQEVRTLARCRDIGVSCPAVYFVDSINRYIIMEYIENSVTVKEFLHNIKISELGPNQSLEHLSKKIGICIALMHKNDIIHGDLTTSNILVKIEQQNNIISGKDFDMYFIDFGLSKKMSLAEDKAVDLYVLERAILSSHPGAEAFYEDILKFYFENVGKTSKAIMLKLKDVQQRGRKRSMVG